MKSQPTEVPMILVMGKVGADGAITLTSPPPSAKQRGPQRFCIEVGEGLLGYIADAAQRYADDELRGCLRDRVKLLRFAVGAAHAVGDASSESLSLLSLAEHAAAREADTYYARTMLLGRQEKHAFWKPAKVASWWSAAILEKRTSVRHRTLNALLLSVFAWDLAAGPTGDDEVFEFAPVDEAIQAHCGESFYPAFARFKTSHECREEWLKHRNSLGILKEWKPKWVAKEAWKLAQSEAGKAVR